MQPSQAVFFCCLLSLSCFYSTVTSAQVSKQNSSSNSLVRVEVAQGWLEGELLDLVQGGGQYYSFKGIPYAAPPVEKLRFKAPQPPVPWYGVRKATAHGPKCMHVSELTGEFVPGSEDCLFLNVYTRDIKPEKPLPVMVFIHGGGYMSDSGDDDKYGPDFLVDHGVILVTFNYRLEVLGFLCLDTEDAPGNAGLKDQVAAIKWVKENIKNFGGDPDNITIFGESAGGASVTYHLLSPLSKGLFKRALSISGVPSCDWSLSYQPRKRAFILGKQLGLETNDPKELFEFLQSVPPEKLTGTNPTVVAIEEHLSENIIKMYHFTPVVEKDFGQEHFITESPFEILKKGTINEADLLIGHTDEEALLLSDTLVDVYAKSYDRYPELVVPRELMIQLPPDTILETGDKIRKYYFDNKPIGNETVKEFATYMSEACFVYDIHRFANRLPKIGNSKRFFFVFSCLSGRNVYGNKGAQYDIYGASHLDDLFYMFVFKSLNMTVDINSREYKLINLVNTVFTNFAKYGTPTPDESLGITWPEYDNSTKLVVDIGDELTIKPNHLDDKVNFWKSIFDDVGIEF